MRDLIDQSIGGDRRNVSLCLCVEEGQEAYEGKGGFMIRVDGRERERERVKMRRERRNGWVVGNVSRFLGAARCRARVGVKLRDFLVSQIKVSFLLYFFDQANQSIFRQPTQK